jgi:flagellar assembly protein FliH
MISRARVLPRADAPRGEPLVSPRRGEAQRRHMAREELEARLAAERALEAARAEAAAVVAEAVRNARGEADALLVARWVALRDAERRRWAEHSDRVVALAVVLAERLLGASLELDSARIAEIARTVLAEAGGARRAVIDAHPLDAAALAAELSEAPLGLESVEIRPDATLARGELRLHTDVGTIDARLAPRFERLATALRDALG